MLLRAGQLVGVSMQRLSRSSPMQASHVAIKKGMTAPTMFMPGPAQGRSEGLQVVRNQTAGMQLVSMAGHPPKAAMSPAAAAIMRQTDEQQPWKLCKTGFASARGPHLTTHNRSITVAGFGRQDRDDATEHFGPSGGPDTPDAPQNAAQIYVALCALQAAVAVPHIVLPVETGIALFAERMPVDLVSQWFLEQMLGLGYFATSISLNILAAGALKNELHKTDYRRLNLGVAAAAIALTAVRTLHWDMQSVLGHLETVFQGGLTAVIPLYFYARTSGHGGSPSGIAQRVVSDLQTLLRPRNINSTVYSAMTVAFLGIGASYIWAPPELVTKIIAHANTPDAMVLWRSIGATLLVLPSWGVTLKAAADQGVPPGQQHQLLNLGLILMGFGHVAILAPLWSTAEAGPLLHHIVAFWGTVGAIGTFGGLSGIRSNPPPDVNA